MPKETAKLNGRLVAYQESGGAKASESWGDRMRFNRTIVPVGALLMVLGVGGLSAYAGQQDNRGRDRNGRESQGQARQRDGGQRDNGRHNGGQDANARRDGGPHQAAPAAPAPVEPQPQRGGGRVGAGQDRGGRDAAPIEPARRRDSAPGGRYENRGTRGAVVPDRHGDERPYYGGNGRPNYERGRRDRRDAYRYDGPRYDGYRTPRYLPGRQAHRHYYGPGGGFNAYFGWGSGYLFGSTYSGRVYGYSAPRVYRARVYYGDVRLQVRPRDSAVYVDGYYAGIVDDFDGVFQRLTLEVGSHQIELEAEGLEPQFFNIYVDPARTVDIRSDLFR